MGAPPPSDDSGFAFIIASDEGSFYEHPSMPSRLLKYHPIHKHQQCVFQTSSYVYNRKLRVNKQSCPVTLSGLLIIIFVPNAIIVLKCQSLSGVNRLAPAKMQDYLQNHLLSFTPNPMRHIALPLYQSLCRIGTILPYRRAE